jgi:hypothetical protein
MQELHDGGRKVFVWNINDEAGMKWAIQNECIDGVCTDDPVKFKKYVSWHLRVVKLILELVGCVRVIQRIGSRCLQHHSRAGHMLSSGTLWRFASRCISGGSLGRSIRHWLLKSHRRDCPQMFELGC